MKRPSVLALLCLWSAGPIDVFGQQVIVDNRTGASGFLALTTGSWQAIYLPTGTPQAIVDREFGTMHRVMKDADVPKRLATDDSEVILSALPTAFTGFMPSQTEHPAGAVERVGVSGE